MSMSNSCEAKSQAILHHISRCTVRRSSPPGRAFPWGINRNSAVFTANELLSSNREKGPIEDRTDVSRFDDSAVRLWGIQLYIMAYVFFTVSMFLMVFSKFLPDMSNPLLVAIKNDWYYSLLLPCFIPTTLAFIYCKWVAMKFFRHA